MFCIHCGKELPDEAEFCNACGQATQEIEEPVITVDPHKVPGTTARVSGKFNTLSKGKKILVFALGAVLLLVLSVFALESRVVIRIPDPEDFFGVRGYETSGGSDVNLYFEFQEDPSQMLDAYFTVITENADKSSKIRFRKTDGENPTYEIRHEGFWLKGTKLLLRIINYGNDYYGKDSGKFVVFFRAESNAKMKRWDTYSPAESGDDAQGNMDVSDQTAPENSLQTESPATISGPILLDPSAFLGNPEPYSDKATAYSGWKLVYRLSIDEGWIAGNEYVELLKNSGNYTLTNYIGTDMEGSGVDQEYYFFSYNGSEKIEPAAGEYWYMGGADFVDYETDVFVSILKFALGGYTQINVEYSNDLTVTDLGHRSTTVPRNSDGSYDSGDSGSGSYKPDGSKLQCVTCWGSKDCDRCNGYGTIERYNGNGETITSDCPDCRDGKCPACNGSGTRE